MNVLAEYWYLWILLVILAVAAFFAWSKAAQAARKRGEKRAEIEEKLKYEARLRKEYAVLTADVIADASQDTLLDGVVCHLQQRLEKQADMTAAFQACTEPEREMYALYYLCEDGVQKLSRFFSHQWRAASLSRAPGAPAYRCAGGSTYCGGGV